MTNGEISLLGFSGMHLNVNINGSVLKMLKTHKGVNEETEFPYEVCKENFHMKYVKGVVLQTVRTNILKRVHQN